MRQHKFRIFVASVFIMLAVAAFMPLAAQPALPEVSDCLPGVLSVTVDAPPSGMANIVTIRLDEHCIPVQESVQTVSVDQLPSIAPDTKARSTSFEPLSDKGGLRSSESTRAGVIKRIYIAEQAIYDAPGILLHKLRTKIKFKFNGSTILMYKAKSGSLSHGEFIPPFCGDGWYLTNHLTAHVSGGVGTSSAGFVQVGEFGYQGFFDCSGNIYYNTLSNHTNVYADGSGSCQFTQHYRTWSYMWRWIISCY